ncbi:tRNA dihydrouridine synthase [Hominifimenecus sp. rT4P-3]|uniref:tRNA dihydrouridine synthase n=1 Tax=Hominifimenecus sp. rT4P-3 TaxID=3242979 RepID=UPI003DA2E159
MRYYFAPMEGITGYLFRNAHHTFFPHIDKYFTPFLSPNQSRKFHTREERDILPENNAGILLVPQLLTNRAEAFLWAADKLSDLGYQEINLNLGCPSATVVSKGKGAGFLAQPERLEAFLDQIFSGTDLRISIKTRVGLETPEEFSRLLEIFNRFPLEELIVHPRVQKDFYRKPVHMECLQEAVEKSKNPICYNGDLFRIQDIECLKDHFSSISAVMLGRGLLANPGLVEMASGHEVFTKQTLRNFHDLLFEGYRSQLFGDRSVLFKMKELWFYLGALFSDSAKCQKAIRKAEQLSSYEAAVRVLFETKELSFSEELPFACGDFPLHSFY